MTQGLPEPSRRTLIKGAGALAMALGTLRLLSAQTTLPQRASLDADVSALPDIQFDITAYLAPARTLSDGAGKVRARMPPTHTVFTTATLNRTPGPSDQQMLSDALATIESSYPYAADGIIMFASYGIPYFSKLPGGMTGSLVSSYLPRLLGDTSAYALAEAVPGPTDVSPLNPGIKKKTFNVPVVIESNDFLLTIRGDNPASISDVLAWLGGSNSLAGSTVTSPPLFGELATVTSSRAQFVQIGMPRHVAGTATLPYATELNPDSPMWMGFIDQQADGSGPAQICTFAGNASARLTTAKPGDYFDNGAIQHLSHIIEDLGQFYALPSGSSPGEPYAQRVQYAFRSDPVPAHGHKDQFTDGGGPAYLNNLFLGTNDAADNAQGIDTPGGEHRLGHLTCVQRSSRSAGGTPMHIRMDGPGFDKMDVPGGSKQPKLQFTIFVPTADFFATLRTNQAALDLAGAYHVAPKNQGLERFLTATRRQNYLIPPRRHRAFPLAEFT